MLRRNVLRRLARPLELASLALALIALLGGCFPPSVALPPATETAIAANATTPTPVPLPASPSPAVTATIPVTGTTAPEPTVALDETPIPTDLAVGFVVQKADKSIQVVGSSGSALPLYQGPDFVDMASIFPPGNAVSDTVFLPFSGKPALIVKLDARGGQPIDAVTELYGLAASPDRLGLGVAGLAAGSSHAEIHVEALNGTQVTSVYSETMSTPQVLRVFRWAPDGKTLYFGKEPVGLGGYILFGGLTNIWKLDTTTSQATELVPRQSPNAAVCIDDLSPDATLAADHCNPKVMELIDVSTHVTRTVSLPAEIQDFGVVGGARFSPDGKQLAFALARRNPDNEQGWVAIADVAGGPSRLIATSPADDYFSVAGFMDANTVILQSAGQVAGVWTVGTDGQNLKRVTDGIYLGILGNPAVASR